MKMVTVKLYSGRGLSSYPVVNIQVTPDKLKHPPLTKDDYTHQPKDADVNPSPYYNNKPIKKQPLSNPQRDASKQITKVPRNIELEYITSDSYAIERSKPDNNIPLNVTKISQRISDAINNSIKPENKLRSTEGYKVNTKDSCLPVNNIIDENTYTNDPSHLIDNSSESRRINTIRRFPNVKKEINDR